MGAAVTAGRPGAWLAALALLLAASPAIAGDRFVLVVSGAAGSPALRKEHARWREAFVDALTGPLQLPRDHLVVLADGTADERSATREHVESALRGLRSRMRAGDLLCVLLIGHGTYDGVEAKFNLVGPDLEAGEWNGLLARLPGPLVIVNTTGGSFPFLERLAAANRIVIVATASPAQKYDTVFPRFFVGAFTDEEGDLDKDGRTSIGEAFAYASMRTRRYYQQRGQLPTEQALLDDSGDGVGKEAGTSGTDGAVASRTFLDAGTGPTTSTDPAISELIARRDALETAVDELKRKRSFMPPADYAREIERVLIELARVSRRIRTGS
jgi:hypothetical protein